MFVAFLDPEKLDSFGRGRNSTHIMCKKANRCNIIRLGLLEGTIRRATPAKPIPFRRRSFQRHGNGGKWRMAVLVAVPGMTTGLDRSA